MKLLNTSAQYYKQGFCTFGTITQNFLYSPEATGILKVIRRDQKFADEETKKLWKLFQDKMKAISTPAGLGNDYKMHALYMAGANDAESVTSNRTLLLKNQVLLILKHESDMKNPFFDNLYQELFKIEEYTGMNELQTLKLSTMSMRKNDNDKQRLHKIEKMESLANKMLAMSPIDTTEKVDRFIELARDHYLVVLSMTEVEKIILK